MAKALVKVLEQFGFNMLNALRQLAAFCLCIALSLGVIPPATSHADTIKPEDIAVIRRQAAAFMETEQRLPELAKLVSEENWTFTRNLDRKSTRLNSSH